jgi:hypothetical protein
MTAHAKIASLNCHLSTNVSFVSGLFIRGVINSCLGLQRKYVSRNAKSLLPLSSSFVTVVVLMILDKHYSGCF